MTSTKASEATPKVAAIARYNTAAIPSSHSGEAAAEVRIAAGTMTLAPMNMVSTVASVRPRAASQVAAVPPARLPISAPNRMTGPSAPPVAIAVQPKSRMSTDGSQADNDVVTTNSAAIEKSSG